MRSKSDQFQCPLCGGKKIYSFYEDAKRIYLRCSHCMLVFVPKSYWLSSKDEKATYDLHENNAIDQGYRQFLSRLSTPLLARLGPNKKGLDFGCGPGPALSVILEEQGQRVDLYDPFYFNDSSVFNKKYDFICATEVVEHLHYPGKEFEALFDMLQPGGWLAVMTKLVIDENAFSTWHYIRDCTHVCFYSQSTFEYLAQRFNVVSEFIGNDVILLMKR